MIAYPNTFTLNGLFPFILVIMFTSIYIYKLLYSYNLIKIKKQFKRNSLNDSMTELPEGSIYEAPDGTFEGSI